MTLVIIPARMGSTRLPGKPLLKIGDRTIIERCVGQAHKAGFEAVVATDSEQVRLQFALQSSEMGLVDVVMTGECASGTDRVAAAAEIIDPEGKHEFVINYQGDMPFLDPDDLKAFVDRTERSMAHITTAYCTQILVNMVPYLGHPSFERRAFDCHVGLYGYHRNALRRFAALKQSEMEKQCSLEQLRKPESFTWCYWQLDSMPIEINTQADLDRARSCLM